MKSCTIETIRQNILKHIDCPLKTSAQKLADRLSISKAYAWNILKGKDFNPNIKTLENIANKLDTNIIDLITGEQ